MIRTRKAGSVTMLAYLSSSFLYTKAANLLLWFYADVRLGLFFTAVVIGMYCISTIGKLGTPLAYDIIFNEVARTSGGLIYLKLIISVVVNNLLILSILM